jgi:hypothetical protein
MFESYLLNIFNFYFLSFFEDFLIVIMIYSFLKLLVLSVIHELIWPTHYFNKKHNVGYLAYRLRSYSEFLLKLKNNNSYFCVYYLWFFKKYFN